MGVPEGSNRESVRRHNLGIVLEHVHRAGNLSRSALTAATGLNRSTIGALVGDLEARGLVREGDAVGTGSPGRPSPMVSCHQGRVGVVAVDLLVSSMTVAVIGLGGTTLDRRRVQRSPEEREVEQTVDQMVNLLEAAIDTAPDTTLLAVGVSVAGMVRRSDGFVHLGPNLEWVDVPLGDLLQARTKTLDIDILVGNEADLGARAEHVRGAGAGTSDIVYVSGEIGVGGGVIAGDAPLWGGAGYAGEIGHMVVNPEGLPCHCGSQGCWETEIGQPALLRHMGWVDTGDPDAIDAIIREAAAGSLKAQRALAEVGRWLGVGIATLINVFNPQRVVLGGFFARAYLHLLDDVKAEVDRRSLRPSRSVATICAATLGEDSSLMGAAEMAFAGLLADPTIVPISSAPAALGSHTRQETTQ